MMGKHTPGPWVVFQDQSDSVIFTVMPAGRAGDVANNIKNGSDARLIAAAPDLLAALIALRDAVKSNPSMQGREYVSLGIQVNNAITKAGA